MAERPQKLDVPDAIDEQFAAAEEAHVDAAERQQELGRTASGVSEKKNVCRVRSIPNVVLNDAHRA